MAKDENNGREKKWTAVRLPRELKEEIDNLIETHPRLGYSGPSDFVRDAVRRRLEELKERDMQTENGAEAAVQHTREIVRDIMGPEGLEVFDRKMEEVTARMKNSGSEDIMVAMRGVLREMMGAAAERSISKRVYKREVEKDE